MMRPITQTQMRAMTARTSSRSDGSKTNGFIDPLPLAESKVGRDMFKAYVATKKGAKMAKVVDF